MHLLERGPVQVELSHHLHEASGGDGRLVFLGGEAGIGKSALVERFVAVVESRVRVLLGACDPLSTPRPLGPLHDMQAALGRRYAELLVSAADRDALFRGFHAELTTSAKPAVVVFEDVHWADEATLDLLRFLGRRLEGVRALVIATYRSDEVGDRHPVRVLLGDLATTRTVRRLALEPLSLDAVRTLCSETALDPVRLHAQTGGNPFFVTQVIASGGHGIPASVRDAVLARAARLSQSGRHALDAAAVLGFRIEASLLPTVAQVPVDAVDELLAGGMLRADGDRLQFHHELAREALLEVLVPHRRTELDRQALAALRDLPQGSVDVGRLAHHAAGAGDGDSVLEYGVRAARRALAVNAHREAAAQFARVLRYADHLPAAERAGLWEAYSWECVATDQWNQATASGNHRVAIWRTIGDRREEGKALSFLVGCHASTGEMAAAEAANRASIDLLEALSPGPELAEAYGMQAYLRTIRHDALLAAESARKVLDLVGREGSRYHQIMGYSMLGTAGILAGDPDQEWTLERSLALAEGTGMQWAAAAAYFNIGTAWATTCELPRAERCLAQGLAMAAEHELDGWVTNMLCGIAIVQLKAGRWAEAEQSVRRVVGDSRASPTCRMTALQVLGRVGIRRGDGAATAVLDEALELALPTSTLQYIAPVRAARAEAGWLSGDVDRAREEAGAALELALEKRHPWLAGELLFWLSRTGVAPEAPPWIARPYILQIEGRWSEAAAEWQRLGCPYEAAQALAGSSNPVHLRTALNGFTELAAEPAARSTLRRLRQQGVRGIPRGPRASTAANPAGLTRREAEVVRLLAENLPNAAIAKRLFLSPKTVGHHVSAVLAKLGVRTRAEAAREAARIGLLQNRELESAN